MKTYKTFFIVNSENDIIKIGVESDKIEPVKFGQEKVYIRTYNNFEDAQEHAEAISIALLK